MTKITFPRAGSAWGRITHALVAGAVIALATSAGAAEPPLRAQADGAAGIFGAATLAPIGSFEYRAAPTYTRLAVVRRQTAVALRKGAITVDQAESVQAKADAVRRVLDDSVRACGQDDRTGKCLKDPSRAERLLRQANAAIVAL